MSRAFGAASMRSWMRRRSIRSNGKDATSVRRSKPKTVSSIRLRVGSLWAHACRTRHDEGFHAPGKMCRSIWQSTPSVSSCTQTHSPKCWYEKAILHTFKRTQHLRRPGPVDALQRARLIMVGSARPLSPPPPHEPAPPQLHRLVPCLKPVFSLSRELAEAALSGHRLWRRHLR